MKTIRALRSYVYFVNKKFSKVKFAYKKFFKNFMRLIPPWISQGID